MTAHRFQTVGLLLAALLLAVGILAAPPAYAEEAAREVDPKAEAAALIAGLKDKDPTLRVKATEKAKTVQHASLLSPLIRLLSDKELGVHHGAIEALGARTDDAAKRKAASALGSRLKALTRKPGDAEELALLFDALGDLGQRSTIKVLLDGIDLEMDIDQVKARIDAVAMVQHGDAIEALIDFLAKGRRGGRQGHRSYANKALQRMTGSKPNEHRASGKDADRWRAWWKDNKKTFSFEAIAAARAEAEAKEEARKERKRKQKEAREKKRKERKNKPSKPAKPAPKKPPVID